MASPRFIGDNEGPGLNDGKGMFAEHLANSDDRRGVSAEMNDSVVNDEDENEGESAQGLSAKRKRGTGQNQTAVIEDETGIRTLNAKSQRRGLTQTPPANLTVAMASAAKRYGREDSPEPTPEDLARMSRSERKRHREKKRRSDVNKGFDDLMSLLVQIDPTIKAEADERARRNPSRSSGGGTDGDSAVLINRVELISRAVTILERVHRENEERKIVIRDLTSRLSGGNTGGLPGDQVMMMVPTLTPVDPMMHAASRGGIALTPQYNILPSSLAQVRLAQQTAGFPPGQFLGFGAHGLLQPVPAVGQAGTFLAASGPQNDAQGDRAADEATGKRV